MFALPVRNSKVAICEPVCELPRKFLAVVLCEVVLVILIQPIVDPIIDLVIRLRSFSGDLAAKCTRPANGLKTIASEMFEKDQQNSMTLLPASTHSPVDHHVRPLVILAGAGHLVPGVPRLDRPVVGHRPNEHLASQLHRAPHLVEVQTKFGDVGFLPRTRLAGCVAQCFIGDRMATD